MRLIERLAGLFVRAAHQLGEYRAAPLLLLAGVVGLLAAVVPGAPRRTRPASADRFHRLGALHLAFGVSDLLGQAVQHPLRIAYPPVSASWFTLLLGRTVISAGTALLALLRGERRSTPDPVERAALAA